MYPDMCPWISLNPLDFSYSPIGGPGSYIGNHWTNQLIVSAPIMSIESYLWLLNVDASKVWTFFFKSKLIKHNKSNKFTAELPKAKYVITYMIMNN